MRPFPCVYHGKDNSVCKLHSVAGEETEYCHFVGCPDRTPSNGDRIRDMSDEELAERLLDLCDEGADSLGELFCDGKNECIDCNGDVLCSDEKIKLCIARWLQQPAEGQL